MTVHGAKGLQAPLVLLPDTTGLPPEDEKLAWSADPATGAPRAALGAAQGVPLPRGGPRAPGGAERARCASTTGCSTSR